MARVRLIFKSVSEIVGSSNIGLLILTDSAEQRQIAIPCDKHILDDFTLRLSGSPVREALLPEVLWNVLRWQTDLSLEIVIDGLTDSRYHAQLINAETLEPMVIRAADAILLSYVSNHQIPIFIDDALYMRQSTVYDGESPGISLPVNTIDEGMLRAALAKAIKDENYELASHLRDELNRRKAAAKGNHDNAHIAPEETE